MTGELKHETLTKTHNFHIRLPLGIKVGPALTAAHRQGGQSIFENLFKGQKFENTEVTEG